MSMHKSQEPSRNRQILSPDVQKLQRAPDVQKGRAGGWLVYGGLGTPSRGVFWTGKWEH